MKRTLSATLVLSLLTAGFLLALGAAAAPPPPLPEGDDDQDGYPDTVEAFICLTPALKLIAESSGVGTCQGSDLTPGSPAPPAVEILMCGDEEGEGLVGNFPQFPLGQCEYGPGGPTYTPGPTVDDPTGGALDNVTTLLDNLSTDPANATSHACFFAEGVTGQDLSAVCSVIGGLPGDVVPEDLPTQDLQDNATDLVDNVTTDPSNATRHLCFFAESVSGQDLSAVCGPASGVPGDVVPDDLPTEGLQENLTTLADNLSTDPANATRHVCFFAESVSGQDLSAVCSVIGGLPGDIVPDDLPTEGLQENLTTLADNLSTDPTNATRHVCFFAESVSGQDLSAVCGPLSGVPGDVDPDDVPADGLQENLTTLADNLSTDPANATRHVCFFAEAVSGQDLSAVCGPLSGLPDDVVPDDLPTEGLQENLTTLADNLSTDPANATRHVCFFAESVSGQDLSAVCGPLSAVPGDVVPDDLPVDGLQENLTTLADNLSTDPSNATRHVCLFAEAVSGQDLSAVCGPLAGVPGDIVPDDLPVDGLQENLTTLADNLSTDPANATRHVCFFAESVSGQDLSAVCGPLSGVPGDVVPDDPTGGLQPAVESFAENMTSDPANATRHLCTFVQAVTGQDPSEVCGQIPGVPEDPTGGLQQAVDSLAENLTTDPTNAPSHLCAFLQAVTGQDPSEVCGQIPEIPGSADEVMCGDTPGEGLVGAGAPGSCVYGAEGATYVPPAAPGVQDLPMNCGGTPSLQTYVSRLISDTDCDGEPTANEVRAGCDPTDPTSNSYTPGSCSTPGGVDSPNNCFDDPASPEVSPFDLDCDGSNNDSEVQQGTNPLISEGETVP